jgi:hypothetical protein
MDLRTLVLGLGVFCATFLVGWWFNIGTMIYGPRTSQAQPVAVAAVPAAATTGQAQPTTRPQVVVRVPQGRSSQTTLPQSAKAPPLKSAYAKDLPSHDPNAKSAPRKSGIRIRRR